MRIGGVGNAYPTYVYNPNVLSSKSMDKLSRISDDVLDKKVDYSETVAEEENQNPLKKGQTIDFEGILAKQMQQGQNRAARIMKNGIAAEEEAAKTVTGKKETTQAADEKRATNKTDANKTEVGNITPVTEKASGSTAGNTADTASDNNTSVMQMQRAIQAYEMFMTA